MRIFPLDAKVDAVMADGTHQYWSTHCRHGDHNLCKGFCKKCGPAAPCVCPCHKSELLTEEAGSSCA
jgi:hypothetical protein